MKFNLRLTVLLLIVLTSLSSQYSFAHLLRHHGFRRIFIINDLDSWHRGHWYHGNYEGRFGWWWVSGSTWYFYPRAYYPYPDPNMKPVYFVEVPAGTKELPSPSTSEDETIKPEAPVPPGVTTTFHDPKTPSANPGINPTISSTNNSAQYYYCSKPEGYYPIVKNCPGGWSASPAPPPPSQPPPQSETSQSPVK